MTSRTIRTLALAAAVAGVLAAEPASAASPTAAGCRLTATARFAPGLSLAGQTATHAVTLSGTLTMCTGQSPVGASVSAGNVWEDPATGYAWREPAGTATGGCGQLSTTLETIVRWPDGTVTVVETSTTSALIGVAVTGAVRDAVVLDAVEPRQPGQPDALTVQTTRFSGGHQAGVLVAMPPNNGTACGSASPGLVDVPLDGAISLAST